MAKINLNNLDLDSREVSYPRKQKIMKRKNKTEGDIKKLSKRKQKRRTYIFIYDGKEKQIRSFYMCCRILKY